MVVFVSGSLTLLASHLWHPDAQHAEAVEAHKYGAAFVSNNPDRQHQTESERRDDEHNDYGQRESKILVNDPPGMPAEGKSEDYVLQVVAHESDVGCLHRNVCAGCPMAMPTVAVASAGASFTPSPTIATGPISFNSLITRTLSSGSKSA